MFHAKMFVDAVIPSDTTCRSPAPQIRLPTGLFCLFREASCTKQDNKKLPELKAIDEPVYINMEVQYTPHSVGVFFYPS